MEAVETALDELTVLGFSARHAVAPVIRRLLWAACVDVGLIAENARLPGCIAEVVGGAVPPAITCR